MDPAAFLKHLRAKMEVLELDQSLLETVARQSAANVINVQAAYDATNLYVRLTFKAPDRAATIEPEGWTDAAKYLCLLMPLRLVD